MRFYELIAGLNELDADEKLQWLVEFGDELPEISRGIEVSPYSDACRIQECQTPVHLWITVTRDRIHLEAAVPRKSPIVRGLVSLVVCGLDGGTISDGMAIPDDMVSHLGLSEVLGMTRQQGFRGVVSRIKQELNRSQP